MSSILRRHGQLTREIVPEIATISDTTIARLHRLLNEAFNARGGEAVVFYYIDEYEHISFWMSPKEILNEPTFLKFIKSVEFYKKMVLSNE